MLTAASRVLVVALALLGLAAPASASTVTLGGAWQVQSSAAIGGGGPLISQPGYGNPAWLPVTADDAGAAGTEVAAQVANSINGLTGRPDPEHCSSATIYFSDNLQTCTGAEIGQTSPPDPAGPYGVPWWFRTTFNAGVAPGQDAQLAIRGLMGRADIWLNGVELAQQLTGSEAEHVYDVTSLLVPGANALALELYPNEPGNFLTQDHVDWVQTPRDQNTGIKYPVRLHITNALALGDVHVVQVNAPDMSSSALTVKATVTNTSGASQTGDVDATITDPQGQNPIVLHRTLTLAAGQAQTVIFNPVSDSALTLSHPQLWWPHQMGGQPLYHLSARVSQNAATSDTSSETFGIRTISTWLSTPGLRAYAGSRWFAINGKPFVFRGGGFQETDLLLRYSHARMAHVIALMKSLGVNGVRLEGHQMPDDFYQQMDEAGLIVYGGFQCCDKWQLGSPSNWLDSDYDTNYGTALAIGRQQRNHPSVAWWSWSDNQPGPLQESTALQGFADADFNVPMIASAEYKTTTALGFSGMKEGPYNWFPPSYAYDILHCASGTTNPPNNCTSGSFVNVGGSWGFDSEQSPGHTIPTLDSLNRFMSSSDLNALIATPQACQFHSGRGASAGGCPGTSSFGSIGSLASAIANRYGTWGTSAPPTVNSPNLSDFLRKAHAINYETQRADFEAFIDHSTRVDSPSTGLNYWMMNQGFPSLLWNLFNSDYDEAGSYFGAKKANEPLHVFYAYDSNLGDPGNRTVNVDNLTGATQTALAVTANVYDIAGHLLTTQSASGISLVSQGVQNNVLTVPSPALPAGTHTYFLELVMTSNGAPVDRNVYWLSTVNDVVSNFNGASPTTTTYGDLTDLQTLPRTTVTATARTHAQAGPDGDDTATDVALTNTSGTLAFMLRVDVRRGAGAAADAGDNQVAPVEYSDNYVTLWPGESQTVTAQYAASLLNGRSPVVSIEGWNVDATAIAGTTSEPAPQAESFGTADGAVAAGPTAPGRANTPAVLRAAARRIAAVRASPTVHGRRVTVRLSCTRTPCRGTLVLRSRGRTLKRVRFRLTRATGTVHVRLAHPVRTLKVEVAR